MTPLKIEVENISVKGHSATGRVKIIYEENMWFCGDCGTEEKVRAALIDAAIYQINRKYQEFKDSNKGEVDAK